MKKLQTLVGLILFLFIHYSATANNDLESFTNNGLSESSQNKNEYHSTPDISSILFTRYLRSETNTAYVSNHRIPSLKHHINLLWIFKTTIEDLFEDKVFQRINFSKTIFVIYRKPDIIFPFHSFW